MRLSFQVRVDPVLLSRSQTKNMIVTVAGGVSLFQPLLLQYAVAQTVMLGFNLSPSALYSLFDIFCALG